MKRGFTNFKKTINSKIDEVAMKNFIARLKAENTLTRRKVLAEEYLPSRYIQKPLKPRVAQAMIRQLGVRKIGSSYWKGDGWTIRVDSKGVYQYQKLW